MFKATPSDARGVGYLPGLGSGGAFIRSLAKRPRIKLRAHQSQQDSSARSDRCLGAKRSRQRSHDGPGLLPVSFQCPSHAPSVLAVID